MRELSRPCVTSFFYLLRRSFLEAKVISKIQKYQTTYLLHVAFLYLMFMVMSLLSMRVYMCSLLWNILFSCVIIFGQFESKLTDILDNFSYLVIIGVYAYVVMADGTTR